MEHYSILHVKMAQLQKYYQGMANGLKLKGQVNRAWLKIRQVLCDTLEELQESTAQMKTFVIKITDRCPFKKYTVYVKNDKKKTLAGKKS